VTATTTVEHTTTTTRLVPVPSQTTSTESPSSESNGTPAWVWVLLGILAVGFVVVIVLLARRGGRGGARVSVDECSRQLDAAVRSRFAQGWAVESQTTDSAVLRRGEESMLVTVDEAGHVSTRPLSPGT